MSAEKCTLVRCRCFIIICQHYFIHFVNCTCCSSMCFTGWLDAIGSKGQCAQKHPCRNMQAEKHALLQEKGPKLPYAKCDVASHCLCSGVRHWRFADGWFVWSKHETRCCFAYFHLPGMKTADDSGLDFGDDCGKERLLTGSMSCLL